MALVLIAATGCGGDEEGSAPDTTATTATTASTTTIAPTTTTTTIPRREVWGSFLVWSEAPFQEGLVPGARCEGAQVNPAYGDIRTSAPMYVEDIRGEILERAELEPGVTTEDAKGCCFVFVAELEYGSDDDDGFVFTLDEGRRGDTQITWDDAEQSFTPGALALTLGVPPLPPGADPILDPLPGRTASLECFTMAGEAWNRPG